MVSLPDPSVPPGLRILIVEDHADTADSLALLLSLYGHEVQVARDGPAALEAARAFPADVVLLDIGLPGMDGWQVAERFQEQAAVKRPLVIAVTGYGHDSDRQRSKAAGIDLHLLKPVEPDQLLGLLSRLLAQPADQTSLLFPAPRSLKSRLGA